MAVNLLALLLATSLHAPGVEVQWLAGAGCEAEVFHAGLERYLAHANAPRPMRVSVEILTRSDGQFGAHLVLSGAHGQTVRELQGATCVDVAEAAAFVTAVAVDPGALASRPEPSAEPQSPAPPPEPLDPLIELEPQIERDPPAPAPSRVPSQGRSRVVGLVRASGGVEAFGMPTVGPLALVAAGLQGRRWRVELTALYRAPTRVARDGVAGLIGLWATGLRGCGVWRPGPLAIPLCAGLEAGQALGEGVDFAGAEAGRLPWIAAVVAPALTWAPRRMGGAVALWAGVELGLSLRRGIFAVRGVGHDLFETGPVSLRAALGIELRIPGGRTTDPPRAGK